MSRSIVYRLEHSALFSEEIPASVESYLKGISKDLILKTGSYFSGFDKQNATISNNVEVLSKWFNEENNDFANDVYKKINTLDKKYNRETVILNIHTTLKLTEKGFHQNQIENYSNTELEKRIFKAYLLLNEIDNQKDNNIFDSLKDQDNNIKWPLVVFVQTFRYADISNADYREVFDEQIIKAVQFFLFIEKKHKSELAYFLAYYKCSSWQEYMRRVFGLVKACVNNSNGFTEITVNDDNDIEFVSKFSFTDESEEIKDLDFISLRSKPFFRVDKNTFRVIFDLFVFEKVFNGIFFTLRAMPGMTLNKIKDIFTFQFSEKTLLYYTLGNIYNYNIKQFSGEYLDGKGFKGAPDYYIRKKNKILLFESKDIVLNAAIKESTSFIAYESEIKKKLYFEEKDGVRKKKAVLQLIENIKKILRNELGFDQTKAGIKIYPILIVHHRQLNVAGLNHLLNVWFKQELDILRKDGLVVKRVAPITLVNISSLMFYSDSLKMKGYFLENLIDEYHRTSKLDCQINAANKQQLESELLRRTYPFNMFLKKRIKRRIKSSLLNRNIKCIVTK